MYITKIEATINVRETEGAIRNVHCKDTGKINVKETEGAIMNVHYKDTGNNKRKRNQRSNHECTLQRYRQHRAQDTKRRQTKQKHNT